MMANKVDKNTLFEVLCKDDIYCTNDIGCLPSTYLAKRFSTTTYQVRKALKELITEGLVTSVAHYHYSDYYGRGSIVRGYCVTKNATQTPIYLCIANEYNQYLYKLCSGGLNESIK